MKALIRSVYCVMPVFILVAFLPTTAISQDADRAGLSVLGNFVGSWQSEVVGKSAPSSPDAEKRGTSEHTVWVLGDRFVLGREITEPGGVKSMWLTTHDADAGEYPFCYFDSRGVQGAEWGGSWNESEKKLTFRAKDTPKDWTSRGVNHFPDKGTTNVSVWMKDGSGALQFGWEGKKTRQDEKTGQKTLAEWRRTAVSGDSLSPEMKVLARLVGEWESTSISKPAVWTPEEKKRKSKTSRAWVLNESLLQDLSKRPDGHENMSLFTYDPEQKVYRSWWFNSEGHRGKSVGKWNPLTESITFHADMGGGLISRGAVRFISEDHHDWRLVVTDRSGKLYFDTKWDVRRSKQ